MQMSNQKNKKDSKSFTNMAYVRDIGIIFRLRLLFRHKIIFLKRPE